MQVDGLLIPELMQTLLAESRWPRDANEALGRAFVSEDRTRRIRKICLYPPPFRTLAQGLANVGDRFYAEFAALHELVPEAAIPIADFGLGADAPILLDYRAGPVDPAVITLEWPGDGETNYWAVMAPDFASFVDMLGL